MSYAEDQQRTNSEGRAALEQDELSVPLWCGGTMEGALWCAVFAGAMLWMALPSQVVLSACMVMVSISCIMWVLHWPYLGRFPFLPAMLVWLLVGATTWAFVVSNMFEVGGANPDPPALPRMAALLCLLTFAVVSGGFTETQISRLLGYMCGVGICEVVVGLFMYRVRSSAEIATGGVFLIRPGVANTLGTDWTLAAFLLCCMVGAGAFAARTVLGAAPGRSRYLPYSRVGWWSSPGVQLATMAAFGILGMMLFLFFAVSIFVIPICAATLAAFVLCLAIRKRIHPLLALGAVLLCAGIALANLARPLGHKVGFSGYVLQRNVHSLLAGVDRRSADAADLEHAVQEGRPVGLEHGDWAAMVRNWGWQRTALLACLIGLCFLKACRAMLFSSGPQSLLAAGACAGLLGLLALTLLGNCMRNPGVALLASTWLAVAAAGGDFEQEVEEA